MLRAVDGRRRRFPILAQPLEYGFAQQTVSVRVLQATSASITGSTQVAFGLVTGCESGECLRPKITNGSSSAKTLIISTVGRREGDKLLYAGKVRSGFTQAVARELRERLHLFIDRYSAARIGRSSHREQRK